MRFVQPGYDADDMATPPNKVIFDSDDIGTLSVIAHGIYRFNNGDNTKKIASWSLDFIPLCTFQFRLSNGPQWRPFIVPAGAGYVNQRLTVSQTGITITLALSVSYVDIAWQAYRLAVTP
ncbi:hypothetical protein [Aquamicrobium soli]|uniref:Uncharacterized protein n=1 Tax=Aquamicrobium soli TaxID=1811518 RepID=A0ABV7K981_9HYPH